MVDGDLGYGEYWMRRYRMTKEREIPTLDWCRIDVKCALVQCIYRCIQSSCNGIPVRVCGL